MIKRVIENTILEEWSCLLKAWNIASFSNKNTLQPFFNSHLPSNTDKKFEGKNIGFGTIFSWGAWNFRDYPDAESIYKTPDSGGECGVPYWTYFPMPTVQKEKPWYSIEQGSVHFTIISTEHDWAESAEQVKWNIFFFHI